MTKKTPEVRPTANDPVIPDRMARVNGEIQSVDFELSDGDTVEMVKAIGHNTVQLIDYPRI